jgi:hypothetical protein
MAVRHFREGGSLSSRKLPRKFESHGGLTMEGGTPLLHHCITPTPAPLGLPKHADILRVQNRLIEDDRAPRDV